MEGLLAKSNIRCKQDEIIFVNGQSINFLGSTSRKSVMNNIECKNSTSSKCFLYLAKDNSSFFSISESCNGKEKCALDYNDMYYSAVKFAVSCTEISGEDFNLLRIGISYDCFHGMYYVVLKQSCRLFLNCKKYIFIDKLHLSIS